MLLAKDVDAALKKGDSARLESTTEPRFAPGDNILTCNEHPQGHTRIPRYARARQGIIVRQHGTFIFPDQSAVDGNKIPEHCYSVRFSMRELWGPAASIHDCVNLDLFESYLQPVESNERDT